MEKKSTRYWSVLIHTGASGYNGLYSYYEIYRHITDGLERHLDQAIEMSQKDTSVARGVYDVQMQGLYRTMRFWANGILPAISALCGLYKDCILEEKSDGRIKLDLAYSASLGDKATTVQGMQAGTIDAAMLTSGVIADYGCDQLKIFTLPDLFTSVSQSRNFEKSDDGKALLDTVQSSGTKIVCIGALQRHPVRCGGMVPSSPCPVS